MLQRAVSLLVLIGFAASQLATIGHAHAWTSLTEQLQHDATSHVHWFGSSSHSREHTHGGHSHSHPHPSGDKHDHSSSSQDRDDATPAPGQSDSEHDSSAIFVSACLALPLIGNSPVLLMGMNELAAVPVSIVHEDVAHVWLPVCMHPPDVDWADSHLYISLRNLRI